MFLEQPKSCKKHILDVLSLPDSLAHNHPCIRGRHHEFSKLAREEATDVCWDHLESAHGMTCQQFTKNMLRNHSNVQLNFSRQAFQKSNIKGLRLLPMACRECGPWPQLTLSHLTGTKSLCTTSDTICRWLTPLISLHSCCSRWVWLFEFHWANHHCLSNTIVSCRQSSYLTIDLSRTNLEQELLALGGAFRSEIILRNPDSRFLQMTMIENENSTRTTERKASHFIITSPHNKLLARIPQLRQQDCSAKATLKDPRTNVPNNTKES